MFKKAYVSKCSTVYYFEIGWIIKVYIILKKAHWRLPVARSKNTHLSAGSNVSNLVMANKCVLNDWSQLKFQARRWFWLPAMTGPQHFSQAVNTFRNVSADAVKQITFNSTRMRPPLPPMLKSSGDGVVEWGAKVSSEEEKRSTGGGRGKKIETFCIWNPVTSQFYFTQADPE